MFKYLVKAISWPLKLKKQMQNKAGIIFPNKQG